MLRTSGDTMAAGRWGVMAKLMTTARSRKRPTRTLAVFLEALDGDIVDIELKNDVVIRGMMDGVDHFSKFASPPPCPPLHSASDSHVRSIYLQNVTSLHPDVRDLSRSWIIGR